MNYLLVGQEEYLKRQFVEKIKKSISHDRRGLPDFEVFHAGAAKISEILESCGTLPFASEKKLIIVKNIDKFTQKEKDLILKYLKSPSRSTSLLLESSSDEFNNKFLEKISKFAQPMKCHRLKERELDLWIKKEFASRGKKISPQAACLVRELTGGDMFSLKNEIEKITAFLGNSDEVTPGRVEALCGEGPYKTAFELVDLVLEKRADAVLASVGRLPAAKEKPYRILNLLAWQFRNFIKIKDLPRGASRERVARALGIRWRFVDKTLERSGRFTRKDLEKNLEIILETDFSVKSGKLGERLALEGALLRLCGLA